MVQTVNIRLGQHVLVTWLGISILRNGCELRLGPRGVAHSEICVGDSHSNVGFRAASSESAGKIGLCKVILVHAKEEVGGLRQLHACWRRGAAGTGFHHRERDLSLCPGSVSLIEHEPAYSQTHADAIATWGAQRTFKALHRGCVFAENAERLAR